MATNTLYTIVKHWYDSGEVDEMSSDAWEWVSALIEETHLVDYPDCTHRNSVYTILARHS